MRRKLIVSLLALFLDEFLVNPPPAQLPPAFFFVIASFCIEELTISATISTGDAMVQIKPVWENAGMKPTSLPQPREQRKIEQLLTQLANRKAVQSSRTAPAIAQLAPSNNATATAHPRVYFST